LPNDSLYFSYDNNGTLTQELQAYPDIEALLEQPDLVVEIRAAGLSSPLWYTYFQQWQYELLLIGYMVAVVEVPQKGAKADQRNGEKEGEEDEEEGKEEEEDEPGDDEEEGQVANGVGKLIKDTKESFTHANAIENSFYIFFTTSRLSAPLMRGFEWAKTQGGRIVDKAKAAAGFIGGGINTLLSGLKYLMNRYSKLDLVLRTFFTGPYYMIRAFLIGFVLYKYATSPKKIIGALANGLGIDIPTDEENP